MLQPEQIRRKEQRELILLYDSGALVQPVYCCNCAYYDYQICHKHYLRRERTDYCSDGRADNVDN